MGLGKKRVYAARFSYLACARRAIHWDFGLAMCQAHASRMSKEMRENLLILPRSRPMRHFRPSCKPAHKKPFARWALWTIDPARHARARPASRTPIDPTTHHHFDLLPISHGSQPTGIVKFWSGRA